MQAILGARKNKQFVGQKVGKCQQWHGLDDCAQHHLGTQMLNSDIVGLEHSASSMGFCSAKLVSRAMQRRKRSA